MDKFFKLSKRNTNVKQEAFAGLTTFLAMSYVLIVNPTILSDAGMPKEAVFTATVISAIIGTLIMGLYANYPVAQAAGMGINAFFTYSVVIGLGYTWQEALFGVFCSGIIFIILSFTGIREKVINSIPRSLKYATSAGIGFFIAFLGLQNSGIIVSNDSTLVSLGDLTSPDVILTIIGLLIILFLTARKNNFAIIIGILVTLALAIILAIVAPNLGLETSQTIPTAVVSAPPSLSPIFGKIFSVDIIKLLTDPAFIAIIFSFLFVDFFDTAGTLIAVGSEAGLLDEDDNLIDAQKALASDGIATTTGAIIGTTSVTSYVESLSGIKAGGRTGLTAVFVAILFAFSLFFSPILTSVASFVTAPALIMVGILMARNKAKIDYSDFASAAGAFVIIIFMITAYSIATGIAMGFLVYSFIKVCEGKFKDVSVTLIILDIIFILYFITTSSGL